MWQASVILSTQQNVWPAYQPQAFCYDLPPTRMLTNSDLDASGGVPSVRATGRWPLCRLARVRGPC
jgi:hypothetical protein